MQRSSAPTAVVIGPVFLDVIFATLDRLPFPGEELWCESSELTAGGAANQARVLARLGFATSLCSYVGQDGAGRLVRSMIDDDGVAATLLRPVPRQAVTASMSVAADRAMVSSGTNEAPPLTGPAPDLLMGDLRALASNSEVVSQWRSQGTYVIGDVGWDASEWWDAADLEPLRLVDLFVPNEEEARSYTRTATAEDATIELLELATRVVVTRGGKGVVAGEHGVASRVLSLPAYPAAAVDPTGAGDVFSAALAWGVLRGGNLRQALSAACLAGALSTERLGGGTPTLDELRAAANGARIPSDYDVSLLN